MRKIFQCRCRTVFVGILLAAGPPAGAAPRAAVMAQAGAEGVADLLTAALSAQPGIELVDREELARVARERGLSAAGLTTADSHTWATLLGAQFLVAVSVEPDPDPGKPPQALARIFAAGPGAILGFARAVDPQDLAAPVLRQVQTGLSAEGEWLPLSVLQFRFPQPESDAAVIERDLTALTVSRLAAQPGILVLERAQLLQAVFEKSLIGEGDPFWSGAFLVEGTIRREVDRLVVQPILRAPAGGTAPEAHPVEFPADHLAEGAERIAAAVAEALGRATPGEIAWSHEAEADAFLAEARWTRRHGNVREMLDLAETALALGATHPDVRRLRMIAGSELAFLAKLRRDPSRALGEWDVSLGYDTAMNEQWDSVLRGNRLRMRDIPVLDSDLMTRSMAHAGRALAVALECFDPSNLDSEGRYRFNPRDRVTIPAGVATALLVAMHRAGLEESLTEEASDLRTRLRELRDRVHRSDYFRRIQKDNYRLSRGSYLEEWAMLEMDYLGYWFEGSREAFAAYRTLLSHHLGQGSNVAVRWVLSRHSTAEEIGTMDPIGGRDPRLIAARDISAESFAAAWDEFLRGLKDDPDPALRLDGHVIGALRANTPHEALAAYENAMPLLVSLGDELIIQQRIGPYARLLAHAAGEARGLDGRWVDLAERWFDLIPENGASVDTRSPFFAVLNETARVSTPNVFRWVDLDSDQRERLQAGLTRFRRRVGLVGSQRPASSDIALPVLPVPRSTRGAALIYAWRVQEAHEDWVRAMYAAGPEEEFPLIRALEIAARFPGLRAHPPPHEVLRAVFEEDRFWILLQTGWVDRRPRGQADRTAYHVIEIHPESGAVRTLYSAAAAEIEGDLFLLRHGRELLLVSRMRHSILRFDPEADPALVEEIRLDSLQRSLMAAGSVRGVLYLLSGEIKPSNEILSTFLHAGDPSTGAYDLLASSRRRPAQSILDDGGTFHLNHLVEGPDRNLWTFRYHRDFLRYDAQERAFDRPLGHVRYPECIYRMPDSTVFLTWEWHLWAIPDGPGPAIWINRNPRFPNRSIPTFPESMQPLQEDPVFPYDTFRRFRVRRWESPSGAGLYFRDRELWVLWQGGILDQGDWELHHWNLDTGEHRARRIGTRIGTDEWYHFPILRPYASGILVGSRWISREDWENDKHVP